MTIFIAFFVLDDNNKRVQFIFKEKFMRKRGRPPGRSKKGTQTAERLYSVALALFGRQGFQATTMREIAQHADVSPGLLYRYFPSKEAVLLRLYGELSQTYAARVRELPDGEWSERVLAATRLSLETLGPHRSALIGLLGVLVSPGDNSLFGARTKVSRERVMEAFERAVCSSITPPACAQSLGRIAYFAHLGVILFWLFDRSEKQEATAGLLDWPPWTVMGSMLRMPGVDGGVKRLAGWLNSGLLGIRRTP